MEGSSESGWDWEGSDSYGGLNTSALVDRNPRFQTSSIRSLDDVLHDSGFVPVRKGRERNESPLVNRLKAQGGVAEDRLTVDRGGRRKRLVLIQGLIHQIDVPQKFDLRLHVFVQVFVYHKAFPMPALSFKFNSTDPLSGDEVDDQAQFISSVCWRGQSSTLVAANSMGNIKLLEMV
ncbi:hypothetical protein K7X08_012293 [Anisodus acutangulus]|uniref:Uncharacterized protein n=1 Tax=Anisodus acutangulus TaxID=402998 RepID=A0A9Q1QY34_9SOLA|nr:hypothetical protein K7X08_012293 [Anisodus acutangulus]